MVHRLVAAIWLGSAVFLMLASSAAFRVAPSSSTAGDFVGAMLTRWHYIALAAPLILLTLELRRARAFAIAIVFSALMMAVAQGFVDLRIRSMRFASDVSISDLRRDHPLRRRFAAWHGISMTLLVLQALAAAIVVASPPDPESRQRLDNSPVNPPVNPPVNNPAPDGDESSNPS